jgi:DNA-binding transcriptional LysR family regulator
MDLIRRLKVNQLRLINSIYKSGQLNLAANSLSISQPAASRILSEIEQVIDVRLFNRSPKGMTPTLIGKMVCERAHSFIMDIDDMSREITEFKQGLGGRVTLGAVTGAAVTAIIPAITNLKSIVPHAEVCVSIDSSPTLLEALHAGKHDFVLARISSDVNTQELDILPAGNERVGLIVNKKHPLAGVKNIEVHDFYGYEWVLPRTGSPMRAAIDQAIFYHNVIPRPNIIEATSLLISMPIILNSTVISAVSTEVADLLTGGQLGDNIVVLNFKEPIMLPPYYLLKLKSRRLSPIAKRFKDLVLETLDQTKTEY